MVLKVLRNLQFCLDLVPWHKTSLSAWLQHAPLHSQSAKTERSDLIFIHHTTVIKFLTSSKRPTKKEKKIVYLKGSK